jgi:predicted Zn-dependent peptidase
MPSPSPRASLVLLALAALLAGAAPSGAEGLLRLDDPARRLRADVLENGLSVITLEDHTTPTVSLQIWVKVGSADESRYTGLAHLFEHMMFKGSKNVEPEMHARYVEARGGRINAFTSQDVTVYFEDVTAESLPLVIDLEAERFANLDVSEKTLASERKVVLDERRMRSEDDPAGRGFDALLGLVWIAHPYRRPVIGWRSDVERATVEVCREFFDTYYVPNNMVMAIAGDFDTAETLARVRRAFGGLRAREPVPRNPTLEPPQSGERRSVVHFDVKSPILAAAWHAPRAGHEDAPALDVASTILSSGRSSRLYRALVYEREKALYAQGGYWELAQAGLFYAFAGARPDVPIGEVEELFFGEIDRIAREGVSDAEVEKAKRQLEVSLVDGLATSHALASRIGREWVTFGRVRSLSELLEGIDAVAADDVQKVVARYLQTDQRSVVHVVPPPAEGAAAAGATE